MEFEVEEVGELNEENVREGIVQVMASARSSHLWIDCRDEYIIINEMVTMKYPEAEECDVEDRNSKILQTRLPFSNSEVFPPELDQ